MGNIVAGVIIIVLGLITNTSMFLGQMTPLNIFFDVLGIIFIIFGIIKVAQKKS